MPLTERFEPSRKAMRADEATQHPRAFALCRLSAGGGVYAMQASYMHGVPHSLYWRIWLN